MCVIYFSLVDKKPLDINNDSESFTIKTFELYNETALHSCVATHYSTDDSVVMVDMPFLTRVSQRFSNNREIKDMCEWFKRHFNNDNHVITFSGHYF